MSRSCHLWETGSPVVPRTAELIYVNARSLRAKIGNIALIGGFAMMGTTPEVARPQAGGLHVNKRRTNRCKSRASKGSGTSILEDNCVRLEFVCRFDVKSPALAAGFFLCGVVGSQRDIGDHVWTIKELLERAREG
jgi:hypothetical protein